MFYGMSANATMMAFKLNRDDLRYDVARALTPLVRQWWGVGDTDRGRPQIEDMAQALDCAGPIPDAFKVARKLEHCGLKPTAQLVRLLDDNIRDMWTAAVYRQRQAWVIANGVQLTLKTDTRVCIEVPGSDGRKHRADAIVVERLPATAQYRVAVPIDGGMGDVVVSNAEEVAKPERAEAAA